MKKPSPITKGTANEFLVAANLMSRGYDVFKALSHNSSCDLIVLERARIYRIEVKTLSNKAKRNVKIPYSIKKMSQENKDKFDILAVVYKRKIEYYPPLPRFYEIALNK